MEDEQTQYTVAHAFVVSQSVISSLWNRFLGIVDAQPRPEKVSQLKQQQDIIVICCNWLVEI